MPDNRKHRGQHPADAQLFAPEQLPRLRQAAADLGWLLSRGYAEKASLKLVGDRFRLKVRQRKALARSACSRQAMEARHAKEVKEDGLAGKPLLVDAFNLLITIESALSGGLIFAGRDGCYRDLASIHGTYKRVVETEQAIVLTGEVLEALQPSSVSWLLDKPVSNSGRLKTMLLAVSEKRQWNWEANLFFNPDTELVKGRGIVVSSDSIILNEAASWFNGARYIIDNHIPEATVITFY